MIPDWRVLKHPLVLVKPSNRPGFDIGRNFECITLICVGVTMLIFRVYLEHRRHKFLAIRHNNNAQVFSKNESPSFLTYRVL